MMDGGGCFRANFGVERDGVSLLAEDGSYPKGSEITTGYPEFDHVLMKKLGWWDELTDAEKKAAEGKNWKTDLSGGIQRVTMKHGVHSVGQREGARGRLELPRRHSAAPRAAVFAAARPRRQVPDARRQEGVLAPADALQVGAGGERQGQGRREIPADPDAAAAWSNTKAAARRRAAIRGSPSCSRSASSRSIPSDANDRGVRDGEYVWVKTPTGAQLKVKAQVTERVGKGTTFIPFHFSGWWMGKDMLEFYPGGRGADRPRRGGQHRDDLRLRLGDDDAGNQDDAVPGREVLTRDEREETTTWPE